MKDRISIEEIERWLKKLETLMPKIQTSDNKGEEMLKNVKAYVSDSKYFLEKEDLVLSFEAMVHAFAVFETCQELGVFEVEQ
jgi:hypothetical protein